MEPARAARRRPFAAIFVWTGGPARVRAGLNLLAAGASERLYISGAGEKVTADAILAANPDVTVRGSDRIEIGHAKDTAGNAAETAAWAARNDVQDILLVTANYHMPRSLLLFRRTAPSLTIYPQPVAAAAGIATLKLIAAGDVTDKANAFGDAMRAGLNRIIDETGLAWAAYGEHSAVHIFTNPEGRNIGPDTFDPLALPFMELKGNAPGVSHKLRLAMLVNGVDFTGWPGGTISAAHGDVELEETLAAFKTSVRMLQEEGLV